MTPVAPSAKVLIAFPTGGLWDAQFGMSLVEMVLKTALARPDIQIAVHQLTTSMLFSARYTLAKMAISSGCSHLLFIDTDQTFPPSLLVRLLSRDRSVVGCNIATKAEPPQETACRSREVLPNGQFAVTQCLETKGLERVWRLGTGIMLIKTKVFQDLPKPWFPASYDPKYDLFTGEDWGFCDLLEKAGIPIWVDHDTSRMVGHRGPKEYILPRYQETQDADKKTIRLGGIEVAPVGEPPRPNA